MKTAMVAKKITLICFILLAGILFFEATVRGESSYPEPVDNYVNDYAGVLDEAVVKAIHKMFAELEHETGIEAVVVTIDSIYSYGTGDTTIESFATNLFNTWGIGDKRKNNGVLILLAVEDRKCRIELGAGYGRRYDSAMKQVIEEKMILWFKRDNYSRGIYDGSRAVVEEVTKEISWLSFHKWHMAIGIPIIVCIVAGISCMRSGRRGWGWALFATAGTLLFFSLRILRRGSSYGSPGGGISFGGGMSFGGGATGSW